MDDAVTLEIVREATNYIVIALENIINFIDLEPIMLEDMIVQASKILTKDIERVLLTHKM